MTAFHLARRLLLCSIVGVTVFGVAGWLLRPRASWEVVLAPAHSVSFVDGATAKERNDPVWVFANLEFSENQSVCLFRAVDGMLMRTLTASTDWPSLEAQRLSDGRLLMTHRAEFNVRDSNSTRFEIVDAEGEVVFHGKELQGFWTATSDGRSAWCISLTAFGFRLTIADIETGNVVRKFDRSNDYPRFNRDDAAVSPDAKWLAVCESAKEPLKLPARLEVWDVETGKLALTLMPAVDKWNARDLIVRKPQFIDSTRVTCLTPSSISPRRSASWTFEIPSGNALNGVAAGTAEGEESTVLIEEDGVGKQIITSVGKTSRSARFAPFCNSRQLEPWRSIPIQPMSKEDIPRSWFQEGATAVRRIGSANQFLVTVWQPPYTQGVPESFRWILPRKLKSDVPSIHAYWHDWNSGVWRKAGELSDIHAMQLRPDRMLVMSTDKEKNKNLQSWPLPPRDPKWPAAGIAVASVVGVWWLCARRARNRL